MAAATPPDRTAPARSASRAVASAASPSAPATGTVEQGQQEDTSQLTFDGNTPEMLAPRPRTWGDCLREGWGDGKPCPWAGCSHHLLLEVVESPKRGQGLRLLVLQERMGHPAVSRPSTQRGMDAFRDRAVDTLFAKRDTCELRVADEAHRSGKPLSMRRIAKALALASSSPPHHTLGEAVEAIRGQAGSLNQEEDS